MRVEIGANLEEEEEERLYLREAEAAGGEPWHVRKSRGVGSCGRMRESALGECRC